MCIRHSITMRTHRQIIAEAGGYQAFAAKIDAGNDVLKRNARFWERRNSIPHEQWPALIAAGLATLDELSPELATAIGQVAAA
jgi:hypothetical protein